MPKDRLEAFGGGVFAIAITLLVLELDVFHPDHGSLAHALAEQWPAYAAYVVSFLTIGIIWINHHAVMANLVAVDRTVLLLNLALLGWVSLIPWPTQLTAEYMRTGGADERTAALVYAGVMAAMGVTFGALWRHATNGRRLVVDSLTDEAIRRSSIRFRIGGPVYGAAMVVALVSAPASLAIIGGLAVYYLPAGRRRDRPPRRALIAMTSDDQQMLAWVLDRPVRRRPPAGCHPPTASGARPGRDPRPRHGVRCVPHRSPPRRGRRRSRVVMVLFPVTRSSVSSTTVGAGATRFEPGRAAPGSPGSATRAGAAAGAFAVTRTSAPPLGSPAGTTTAATPSSRWSTRPSP